MTITRAKCGIGRVIFLSAEDSPEDTIVPRLTAAGADLSKVIIIDSVNRTDAKGHTGEHFFDINADLPALEKMLSEIDDVAVIFIDPISAYIGDVDDNKNSRIRATLAPLCSLAEAYNVAVVCISHNNKNSQQDAIHRVTGSIGYVAASRAVFVVVKDKDNEQRRLFLPLKNNIGNDKTGLAYSLAEHTIEANNIITSKIIWESGSIDISANDAMSSHNNDSDRLVLDDAKAFLIQVLSDGPVLTNDIFKEAENAHISDASVRRAKKALKIIAKKKTGTKNSPWYWLLGKDESKFDQGV